MLIYKGNFPILKEEVVVIPGIFDGLHLGHQTLIKEGIGSSKNKGIAPCVLLFNIHSKPLLDEKERNKILKNLGVKYLVIPFFNNIKDLSCYQFIELLCSFLKVKEIWCGSDYGFGKGRTGNVEILKALGKEKGFSVFVIRDVCFEGKRISTSYIKNLLLEGKTKEANFCLTRPFSLSGIVSFSSHRGTRLGFKTANIPVREDLFIPRQGVYFGKIKVERKFFYGMVNLGTRPTFNEKKLILEANIFDFNKDIYGRKITIFFLEWIRDEIRFNNERELYLQIKKDKEVCQSFLSKV